MSQLEQLARAMVRDAGGVDRLKPLLPRRAFITGAMAIGASALLPLPAIAEPKRDVLTLADLREIAALLKAAKMRPVEWIGGRGYYMVHIPADFGSIKT